MNKYQLLIVHNGDGSDITGYFLIPDEVAVKLWKGSVDGYCLYDYVRAEENTDENGDYIGLQFHHVTEVMDYIRANNIVLIHECAVGSY